MKPEDVPLVREIIRTGADDRVFDLLLVVGPLLVVLVALLGRSVVTTALAGGYLLAFVGYTLFKGLRRTDSGV
ncbi:hypothetical protein C474_06507 [Halogeometricum pallidum JCM 14848]|uniref:Uncharacterized protein n=1 Tax=Halogeometricum pallidum JCM 14848 TaxID=1227487 RepID=M0DAH6_HALPD|nr:hypothetical protein [Halogeometricum pallidum]ELZ32451.1 hypothetical protein C474_06507 [Halogeometricum pallidum JCM 14848]